MRSKSDEGITRMSRRVKAVKVYTITSEAVAEVDFNFPEEGLKKALQLAEDGKLDWKDSDKKHIAILSGSGRVPVALAGASEKRERRA